MSLEWASLASAFTSFYTLEGSPAGDTAGDSLPLAPRFCSASSQPCCRSHLETNIDSLAFQSFAIATGPAPLASPCSHDSGNSNAGRQAYPLAGDRTASSIRLRLSGSSEPVLQDGTPLARRTAHAAILFARLGLTLRTSVRENKCGGPPTHMKGVYRRAAIHDGL